MSLRLMSSVSYVGLTAANVFFEKVDKPLVQPEKLETEDDFISHLDTIGVLSASIRSSLENIKYLQSFHDQNQLATEVNQYLSENNSSLGLRIRKWPANHQDKNGHELSVQNGDKTQLAIIRLCDRKQQAEGYAFGPKITTVCESYNSQSNAHAGEIAEVTEMASGNAFKMPQRRISMISVGSLSSPKCYEKDVDYVNENYSFQSFFGGSNSSLSSDSSVSSPSGSVHSLDNDNVRSASSTPYSDSDTEIQDQFWDMSPMNSANPWSQEKDQETHSETSVEPVMDNRELTVDLISPLPYVDNDNDNDNDNDIDSEDESIFNPASPVSAVVQSPVHAVSVEQTQCYDASEPDSISVTTGESHSSSESVALVDEGQRQDYSDINTDDVLLMLSTPTLAELRTNPFFPSTDEFQKENVATTHHSEPASPNVQMHNMATRSAPVSPKNGLYNPTPHIQFDRQCQKETNFGSELIYNVNSALSNVPAANYDMTETHLFQSYLPPLMVSQHQSTQQINHSENGLSNRNFSMHFLNQNPYLIDGMIDYLDRSIVSKMNELSFCLAVKGPNEIRLLRELVELRRKDEMVKKLRTDRVKLQQPQPLNVFQPMVTPMNMPIHNSGYQSEYLAPFQPDANRQMYVPQMPCNPYERVAPSYPPAQYLTTQQWHYERNVSIHPAHQNRPVSTCQPVRVLTESNDSINIVENNNFDTVLTPLPVECGNSLGFEGLNTPMIHQRISGKGNLFVFPGAPSAIVHPEFQNSQLETVVISPASRAASRANSPQSASTQNADTQSKALSEQSNLSENELLSQATTTATEARVSVTGNPAMNNRKREIAVDQKNVHTPDCKRVKVISDVVNLIPNTQSNKTGVTRAEASDKANRTVKQLDAIIKRFIQSGNLTAYQSIMVEHNSNESLLAVTLNQVKDRIECILRSKPMQELEEIKKLNKSQLT